MSMRFLADPLSDQDSEMRRRIMLATIDAVVDTNAGSPSEAAVVNMRVALGGLADAAGWMASNVPEYSTPEGAKRLADEMAAIIELTIIAARDVRSSRFARPIDQVGNG